MGFSLGAATAAGQRVFCLVVGAVGLLAFVRHNITAASDAVRLGFDGGHRGFQYEVGFANLAFGVTGLLAAITNWGQGGRVAALVGFGTYLAAVMVYHSRRTARGELVGKRAVLVVGSTAAFAAILLIVAGIGARANGLWPF